MKNITNVRGITLIALVITIIILLILAGISIATLTGENGILTKVENAKTQTIEEEEKEQIKLAYNTVMADKLHNGQESIVTSELLKKELDKQNVESKTEDTDNNIIKVTFTKSKNVFMVDGKTGNITQNGIENNTPKISISDAKLADKFEIKTQVVDENNNTFIIPAGFKIATDSANTIDEGIVIEDKNHNQFVWIPVDPVSFERTTRYSNGSPQSYDLTKYTEPFINGYKEEIAEESAMKQNVKDNHGFYMGRFETGKDAKGNVVVQKEFPVYSDVPWGNSMTDISQGAVRLSKDFSTNNSYQDVTSTLCYGIQWDAALKFIDTDYAKDSRKQGWYQDNYNSLDTGNKVANPNNLTGFDLIYGDNPDVIANKQKNIYDMAGNVWEWTMEAFNTDRRVHRGGFYGYDGFNAPASRLASSLADYHHSNLGFRIALHF